MSIINATPLLAAAGGDYQISRSVRLRSSASAYFNRTPASAGNRKTWTWSGWVKRGGLTTYTKGKLFGAGTTGGTNTAMVFGFGDSDGDGDWLLFQDVQWATSNNAVIRSSALYRDASAWYHIVLAVDTTQATGTDRVKIFVNGLQISTTFVVTPSLNVDMRCNTASMSHYVGSSPGASVQNYFDGYLTEVNFIDGQALTPSSFGETDSITGVWKPKKYAGTYGTNGFYLNFSDNSAATAAAIGKDNSGNGNNWTPNNISVTAGTTYDSMLDVPTLYADGGNGRGNYAVMNPLYSGLASYANANLQATTSVTSAAPTTFFQSSGKWYWEVVSTSGTAANTRFGVCNINGVGADLGGSANGWAYLGDGRVYNNGSTSSYGVTYATNDVLMIALDLDAGRIWYGKNGTWMASGDPASNANPSQSFTANQLMSPAIASGTGSIIYTANFGQRPFAYTPPTGFKALNTQNLPEPTIKKGNQYFDATTYTGNGSTQSIVNSGAMQPDLVWAKNRATTTWNSLQDVIRGATKELYSNATDAEATYTNTLTSFNSNGFSVGNAAAWNGSGNGIVAWQWKESPSAGFDIVTYTQSASTATVNHSLGVAPKMIIVKDRTGAGTSWYVYHASIGAGNFLTLNSTAAQTANTAIWNNTAPTSSVFSWGPIWSAGDSIVAYLFAEVAGFSKFGSYTGNGSADGPFVFTGFRPRYVMIKRTDSSPFNWIVLDTARSQNNVAQAILYPNISNAEDTITLLDFTSNGFKIRTSDTGVNANGGTYIFAAFAESPFKTSLAR